MNFSSDLFAERRIDQLMSLQRPESFEFFGNDERGEVRIVFRPDVNGYGVDVILDQLCDFVCSHLWKPWMPEPARRDGVRVTQGARLYRDVESGREPALRPVRRSRGRYLARSMRGKVYDYPSAHEQILV